MKNLRLLREEFNLSQQKLGDEFGLAQSQIMSYEKGAYEPDIATLGKFADFFDVSVDFLIGKTDIRRKPELTKEFELTADEQLLVERYRALRPSQRPSLAVFLDTLEADKT